MSENILQIADRFATVQAVDLIKNIASYLPGPYLYIISYYEPINIYGIFNYKELLIWGACFNHDVIDTETVLTVVSNLILEIIVNIRLSYESLPEKNIVSILSEIIDVSDDDVRLLSVVITKIIEHRKYNKSSKLPDFILDFTCGHVPLINHDKSPLLEHELILLKEYMGTTRDIYVHILLNCLFEMKSLYDSVKNIPFTKDISINILTSKWFKLIAYVETL